VGLIPRLALFWRQLSFFLFLLACDFTHTLSPPRFAAQALTCVFSFGPAKTEALCTSIVDNRKNDPWGGNGYLSTILRAVKMQDATEYSADETKTEFPPALDYATSAQRELLIREQSAALVCYALWLISYCSKGLVANNNNNNNCRSRLRKTSPLSSVTCRSFGSSVASIPSPIPQTKKRTGQKRSRSRR